MRTSLLFLPLVLSAACGTRTETPAVPITPDEVTVRFVRPLDGDTLSSPFGLAMEVTGVDLLIAGTMTSGSGHLHVLVDTSFVAPGMVIPKNATHIHFGDASTEAEIALSPGEHVLKLQLGDGAHIAFEGDAFRDEIRIFVRQ